MPIYVNAADVSARLRGRVVGRNQFLCRCPVPSHGRRRGDRNPSLSLTNGDDGRLIPHCFAGCDDRDIAEALQHLRLVSPRDLVQHNGSAFALSSQTVIRATYNYDDEQGHMLYQVVRYDPKSFRQRRPDGNGGWIWNLNDVPRVLYRLPGLIEAIACDRPVVIVEGEKDVDNLRKRDIPATCNSGGASKWRDEFAKRFTGANVIIIPDNDASGRAHAEQVAASIAPVARRVRVLHIALHWPECPEKGDISDWLAAGGTPEAFWNLIEQTPDWRTEQQANETSRQDGKALIIRCATEITPERTHWIWAGRLAVGAITLVGGDAGTGKTTAAISVAATITRGGDWPCGEGRATLGSVVILAAEDSVQSTLVPRLMAAGADKSKVHIVTAVKETNESGERLFNLTKDLDLLDAEISRLGDVRLVVIDPVNAYIGKTDSFKDAEVRQVLTPMAQLSERWKVAIWANTHFTKNGGAKALYRFLGSVAYVGVARIAFAMLADADSEGRLLMLHAKNNLAPPARGLAFRLLQRIVTEGVVGSYAEWESNHVSDTADEALAAQADAELTPTRKDDAIDFLRDVLGNGRVKVIDLDPMARAAGLLGEGQSISQSKPFRSARKALGIKPYSEGFGTECKWWWALPGTLSDALSAQ